VSFSAGQLVGPIAGFSILALAAIIVTAALLRTISDSAHMQTTAVQAAPT
jgi:hypothetical protein